MNPIRSIEAAAEGSFHVSVEPFYHPVCLRLPAYDRMLYDEVQFPEEWTVVTKGWT